MRIRLSPRPLVALALALISVVACSTGSLYGTEADNEQIAVGDFTLTDYRGKEHRLSDYADSKVVVIAVIGTECPLAKLYANRLQELSQAYRDRSVTLLALDSNLQDSLAEIGAFARRQALDFPILKDQGTQVADQLGATRTPEVFVLDANRTIRYHGRIDDQYGIGYAKKEPTTHDLRDAVDAILEGKEIVTTEQPAVGCRIGRTANKKADSDVTYSNQVARILQKHCVECHREGEIGPMALTDYSEVAGWAEMIGEVIQEKRMPPWHANPAHGQFANDRSLSEEERKTIHEWIAAGAPEGNPKDLPEPLKYVSGWQLSREPDAVFAMDDKPFNVPAEGDVRYQYFKVDPKFTEDKWLQSAEILPGNRAVVHHVLVFIRPKGVQQPLDGERGFLVGYVPGARVQPYPEGMAKRIPANSELIFQIHYTPIGTKQQDLSKVGFVFADASKITHEVTTTSVVQVRLNIPPNDPSYRISATLPEELPDCELLWMSPHMHLRGSSFRYELIQPDGQKEVLLDVPEYDFNWQTTYWLKQPMKLKAGSKVFCEATFDNSSKNLNNPDPTKRVRWGDQTYEEMMIGYFDVAVKIEDIASGKTGSNIKESRLPRLFPPAAFGRTDKDGDGRLQKSEVPKQWQILFDRLDSNKDGEIDRDEFRRVEIQSSKKSD